MDAITKLLNFVEKCILYPVTIYLTKNFSTFTSSTIMNHCICANSYDHMPPPPPYDHWTISIFTWLSKCCFFTSSWSGSQWLTAASTKPVRTALEWRGRKTGTHTVDGARLRPGRLCYLSSKKCLNPLFNFTDLGIFGCFKIWICLRPRRVQICPFMNERKQMQIENILPFNYHCYNDTLCLEPHQ